MDSTFAFAVISVVACAFVGGAMLTLGIVAMFFNKSR